MVTPSKKDADVIVVGAGLAGLATAITLQAKGRSVLVLERRDEPSQVDTGITLWSFAIEALGELGVSNPAAFGFPIERLISYAASGRKLTDIG